MTTKQNHKGANRFRTSKLPAFTLSELLVVLVIIGILILMALPVLMPLISKTRSVEAKQSLKHLHMLQKSYFYEYARFSPTLQSVSFEQEPLVTDGRGGKANYKVEIVSSGVANFLARATAVVDFDGDGQYNVWEIDQDANLTEITPD